MVSDTRIEGGGNENKMGTIVSEGRGEVKPSCAMLGPRRALLRRVMGDDQLACGVNGMGGKVYRLAMKAMPSRQGRVWCKVSHMVKG